jgi:hypothetical protein
MTAPKTPFSSQAGAAPEIGGVGVCAPMPGVQRIQHLARGKKLAPSCEAFSAPGARAVRGLRPEKPITGTEMNHSPYLDKPFVPLAVALRSMLAETEAKILTAAPAEKARLQQRAGVLRDWLTPKSTIPPST